MNFTTLNPWVIPVIIYLAKITEISLMSVRIIMIARGFRVASAIIAMVEATVWISILSLIVSNLDNVYNILAFVLGMGSGTMLGILFEKKLALGLVLIRVITQKPAQQMLAKLRELGFRVTAVNGTSNYGPVQILFSAVRRKNIDQFASVAKHFNPKAFFTVEDIREASQIIINSKQYKGLNILVDQKFSDIPNSFSNKTKGAYFNNEKNSNRKYKTNQRKNNSNRQANRNKNVQNKKLETLEEVEQNQSKPQRRKPLQSRRNNKPMSPRSNNIKNPNEPTRKNSKTTGEFFSE